MHGLEGLADGDDLVMNGGFGVERILGDPVLGTADQPRIAQHLEISLEQIAEILGCSCGERAGTFLKPMPEPRQLAPRADDGGAQALLFRFNLRVRQAVLGHPHLAGLKDIGHTHADARRYAEALNDAFADRLLDHLQPE